MGSSSIAFLTGSVVVPRSPETIATGWPAMAFSRLDLPALHRPANTMRTLSPCGVPFMARPPCGIAGGIS